MGDTMKSKDLALRAQKKILGKMASKNLTRLLIDDKTSEILDEFGKIIRDYSNKKEADKMHRNLIKVMIKIAILHRNDCFSKTEKQFADQLQNKTRMAAMTMSSFCDVEFSCDKYFLSKQINDARVLLQQLLEPHVKEKSKERINSVFDQLGDTDFLETLFDPCGPYRSSLEKITIRINDLIEEKIL